MADVDNLTRIPILQGSMCLGLSTEGTPHLVFASERHGLIRVRVSPSQGGDFLFTYVIRDDRTGTVTQYQGPHGDPDQDQVIKGPYGVA